MIQLAPLRVITIKFMKSTYCIIFCFLIFSCKSQRLDLQIENSHLILDKVLNEIYKDSQRSKSKNFEIFTRKMDDSRLNEYINTIKLINEVDETISIDSTWFNGFSKMDTVFDVWNPSLLNIKNLNTQFELKEDNNKELLDSKIKEKKLGEQEQYEERVIVWVKENRTFNIVSATPPVFSHNKEKALIFTSIYNGGLTAWLFKKQDGNWEIISNLDIAMH